MFPRALILANYSEMINLPGEALIIQAERSASAVSRSVASRLAAALNRPLIVGVLGEIGSGKSSLLNALFNKPVMPILGVGRTRPIIVLKYGNEYAAYSVTSDKARHRLTSRAFQEATMGRLNDGAARKTVLYRSAGLAPVKQEDTENAGPACFEVQYPLQILRSIEFVEYPGYYNLALKRRLKWPRLSRIDIAIWTTVASSAWKRSEMRDWTELRAAPADQSILTVTQADSLVFPEDRARLMERLQKDAGDYFSSQCIVSAKLAINRKMETGQVQDTGLEDLKKAISRLANSIHQRRIAKAVSIYERSKTNQSFDRFMAQSAIPAYSFYEWETINEP